MLTRYGLAGLVNNVLLYLAFVTLVWAGVDPVLTAGLCYVAGVAISYWLNRVWTFKSTSRHRQDLPRFLIAYATGFVATLVILSGLLRWMSPQVAQILNVGLTAAVIYLTLRLLKFGHAAHAD